MTFTSITIDTPTSTAGGPQQLLRDFESYLPPVQPDQEILLLALDLDGNVVSSWQAGRATSPARPNIDHVTPVRLVVVLRLPDGPAPTAGDRACVLAWSDYLSADDVPVLDALLCQPSRWWSAMCDNPACCPLEGRVREYYTDANPAMPPQQRRRLWQSWQQMRDAGVATAEPLLSRAVGALRDVRLRDCLLADAGAHPLQRKQWAAVLDDIRKLEPYTKDTVVITLRAAIHYLDGDSASAISLLTYALNAEPTYSLAVLLRRGLQMEAPPTTVESAFRNADINKLLGPDDDALVTRQSA